MPYLPNLDSRERIMTKCFVIDEDNHTYFATSDYGNLVDGEYFVIVENSHLIRYITVLPAGKIRVDGWQIQFWMWIEWYWCGWEGDFEDGEDVMKKIFKRAFLIWIILNCVSFFIISKFIVLEGTNIGSWFYLLILCDYFYNEKYHPKLESYKANFNIK